MLHALHIYMVSVYWGFPGGSAVKNLPTNTGDTDSVAGSGGSPGEGNPTPVFLPGKPYGQRIAKFRLRLKKAGKTTKPFRCDLNQIPDDYTLEETNRFEGLGLVDRVPDELWWRLVTLHRRRDQNNPKEQEHRMTRWCLRSSHR